MQLRNLDQSGLGRCCEAAKRIFAVALLLCALVISANAKIIVNKGGNQKLNNGKAWNGGKVPGAKDTAQWTTNTAASTPLGGNLTWQGIQLLNTTGVTLNITGGQKITLGNLGIDMSTSGIDLTLGTAVALSVSQTWNVNAGRTLTDTGIVSGNGNLTKNGLGTLILSGANTYRGSTTINAGTVSINSVSSLGGSTTPIFLNQAATLQATGTFTSSRGITLGGTGGASSGGTLDVTGANVETRTGVISGTGSLTKTGTGTLALSGVNTYTGETYVLGGTLSTNSNTSLGPQPTLGSSLYAIHLSNGTTLQTAFSSATARQVELVSGSATLNVTTGTSVQVNGLVYGNGGLIKAGTGTAILTNANTYSGGTTINGGTLQVTNSTGSGSGTGAVSVNSGGTLSGVPTAFTNPGTISGAVTVNSGGAITARSGGTFTLGGLTLNAGATSNFQIGAATNTSIINLSGINNLSLAGLSTVNITNAGGLAGGTYHLFDYNGAALGSIANLSLGSTPGGGFTYALSNNTGNTSIDLVVTPSNWEWNPNSSSVWSTSTNWVTNVTPNAVGAQANFFSHITAPVTVTVDGNFTVGTITFNNANSYTVASSNGTNKLTLDNGGTALIATQLGAHTISAPLTLANNLQLNSSAGSSLTLSGVISETGGSRNVTVQDAGTVTFSGTAANTYTGSTTVSTGTLNLNKTAGVNAIGTGGLEVDASGTVALLAANQIPDTTTVLVNGTFALGSSSETIAALNGTGSVTTAAGSLLTIGASNNLTSQFDGVISGGGTITKAGTGTLTLSGTNTFGGAGQTINVNAGILSISSDANLGNTANTLTFNGGSLSLTDDVTSARNIIMNSAATINTNENDFTVNGIISGNNALTKDGTGTMFLNSTNTYSGGTTINNGTIVINNANNLGTNTVTIGPGTLEVATGFTTSRNIAITDATSSVAVDAGQNYTVTGVISGAGSLNKEGTGTLTVSGNNTFTGETFINAGTLTALSGGGTALSTSPAITVNDGGTLLLGGTDQISNTTPITLAGGTIAKGNFSEGAMKTVGLGALTLTSDSFIDFGTGTVGVLTFASLTLGTDPLVDFSTLKVLNWTGVNGVVGTASTDRLIFDSDQSANLAFFDFGPAYSGAIEFNLGSGFFEVVPVPEPSTWAAGVLALGALGYAVRKRRARATPARAAAVK
jgi:autotransporter-associated beta strand protein